PLAEALVQAAHVLQGVVERRLELAVDVLVQRPQLLVSVLQGAVDLLLGVHGVGAELLGGVVKGLQGALDAMLVLLRRRAHGAGARRQLPVVLLCGAAARTPRARAVTSP